MISPVFRRGLYVFAAVFGLLALPQAAWAACTNPAGVEGEIIYNGAVDMVQFCNGTDWINAAGTSTGGGGPETDPEVGTLTPSKWCTASAGGTEIVCTTDAPTGSDNLGNHLATQDVDAAGFKLKEAGSVILKKVAGNAGINGTATLPTLADVQDALNPADGEVLTYNNTAGEWQATAPGSGADNLGDHTATQDLSMAGNDILNAGSIASTGTISTTGSIQVGTSVTCTLAEEGAIRYAGGAIPWEYCDGGGTWLPFRQPRCQNNGAGECYLDAPRSNDDPDFVASNIATGVNILGVTGSFAGGSPACTNDSTAECTLSATRSAGDAQFIASNIRCGLNILGVTGNYGNGSSGAFSFTDVTNAPTSTLTTASAVTISGIPAGCPGEVTVSGTGSPQISIAGGAWGTSGPISNGQTLAVRLTSSASSATEHAATVSIGDTQDVWSVSTVGADTTPDAFTFTDQTNVTVSTLTTSNTINISGINVSAPVSVSGGGSPQVSINGGAWVTSGSIANGQSLRVRLTSSASFSTALTATVDVGGVTDVWSVTTMAAPTTDVQTFTASGTWTKPAWATSGTVNVKCWGGGGGGGNGNSTRNPKGGGGGGYSDVNLAANSLPGTVAVTIGAGGAGGAGGLADGLEGGDSWFGAYVNADGGSGGSGTGCPGTPGVGGGGTTENGGDAGNNCTGNVIPPLNTTNSGAGGGSVRNNGDPQAGGISTNGGDGGNGDPANATDGQIPGGGGGAEKSGVLAGAGARGECVVTTSL